MKILKYEFQAIETKKMPENGFSFCTSVSQKQTSKATQDCMADESHNHYHQPEVILFYPFSLLYLYPIFYFIGCVNVTFTYG